MASDVALEEMTIDNVADWLVTKGFDDNVVDAFKREFYAQCCPSNQNTQVFVPCRRGYGRKRDCNRYLNKPWT